MSNLFKINYLIITSNEHFYFRIYNGYHEIKFDQIRGMNLTLKVMDIL